MRRIPLLVLLLAASAVAGCADSPRRPAPAGYYDDCVGPHPCYYDPWWGYGPYPRYYYYRRHDPAPAVVVTPPPEQKPAPLRKPAHVIPEALERDRAVPRTPRLRTPLDR